MTSTPSSTPAPAARRSPAQRFADLSIRTKVLTPALVGVAAALVVGLFGLNALSGSAATSQRIYQDNLAAVKVLGEISVTRKSISLSVRDILLVGQGRERQATLDEYAELQGTFDAQLDEYLATGVSNADRERVEQIRSGLAEYLTIVDEKLGPIAAAQDLTRWLRVNNSDAAPVAEGVSSALGAIIESEDAAAARSAQDAQAAYESARTLALVLLGLAVVVVLVVGLAVARGISTNVARVRRVSDALAAGDLTVSSGVESRDEVGRMGQSLDVGMDNLRTLMASVGESADAVAAASEELSAGSQQIAAGAEETSVQAGVVSGAAEEVSRNVST
ncbi:methyl-accepting chemotaxis protein, partial [Nocardioides sp. NPDC092400]|uniref:methyl-accepting chemotaxis protein n=1 Tax=Nocardioides sp. NPDC092400 TaxID=3155196 RepID=UPI0034463A6B